MSIGVSTSLPETIHECISDSKLKDVRFLTHYCAKMCHCFVRRISFLRSFGRNNCLFRFNDRVSEDLRGRIKDVVSGRPNPYTLWVTYAVARKGRRRRVIAAEDSVLTIDKDLVFMSVEQPVCIP
ncbi:hypothetical protein RB195_015278 [Necator americanus]|uniref:Uncharacterized protein n=1 Tax=Necator americanus TaxID=51031 RepID=A0ABR1E3T2_NECAM